jgi:hypothetical protein
MFVNLSRFIWKTCRLVLSSRIDSPISINNSSRLVVGTRTPGATGAIGAIGAAGTPLSGYSI